MTFIHFLKRFPAELHLVHVREDFVLGNGTVDEAAFSDPEGLSVLGIFIDVGENDVSTKTTMWFDVLRLIYISFEK